MGEKPQNIKHRHISLGVLAHVDAGKTTLSEGLLFKCGRIRKIGRVDHKDAYLDTYELERERGITPHSFFHGGYGSDTSGYTGACGFFC